MKLSSVKISFQDFSYRAPMKFGGKVVDRATVLSVEVAARDKQGREAVGTASMPLGNGWSWPSKELSFQETAGRVKAMAGRMRDVAASYRDDADALRMGWELQKAWRAAAQDAPALAAVVAASAFDLAIHDAFARLLGRNIYGCYGPDCVGDDLSAFLGSEFKGEYLDRYTSRAPKPSVFLYHTVGALDALTPAEVAKPVGDGIPESLSEWIAREGVHHLKVKLNGNDLAWDIARLEAVHKVAPAATYSLDFNETCPNLDYMMGFIRRAKCLGQVQLFEQPTSRDAVAAEDYSPAAKIKPLVADEALVDMESFGRCLEMGYNGVALKACKGQTLALLMGAAAQKKGLFLCVMDLTCPGQSFLESAGLAARVPGVTAIEGNARQYLPPAAHAPWDAGYPEVFHPVNGSINTSRLNAVGLGH